MSCALFLFFRSPTPLPPSPFSLRRYAAPSAPPHVRAIVLVAWITSASTVALVPVDVYAALSGDAPGALPGLWAAAYWTTQVRERERERRREEEMEGGSIWTR